MRKQLGLTLIEILVSLGILASVTAGVVTLMNQQSSDTGSAVASLHLKTVGDAANEYIKDNYAAITGIATATNPALIRVSDLIAGGYLTSGFSTSNPRQQNTCVLVLQPTANNLIAMTVTEGGDTIDDLTLGQIAATVGAAGGGIYSTAPTTFRGAMGGWSLAIGNFANANHLGQKCNGTAGAISLTEGHPVMALWFADGASVSATLYRDPVPGNPTLNTMNTPILMGAGTVQTVDAVCTTKGALGRDNDGKVLTCVDNAGVLKWTTQGGGSAYWGDPKSVGTNTPTQAQLDTVLGICSNTEPPKGRTHMVYGASGQPRPYVCDGTDWQPVAVDLAGNMLAAGTLTTGKVAFNDVVTEGTACTPNGLTARDTTGLLLSCQSGTWKKATGDSGAIGGYTFKINGYSSPLFYGVGKVVSGQFFGDLMCDPQTVASGAGCGVGGRAWCGSSASCAWDYAHNSVSYGYGYTVGASALPINTIVQKW